MCAPATRAANARPCSRPQHPDLPIERGRPGPGLIANILVGKFCDGLPLYRQSVILAREGIDIDRATLADWLGHAAWWLAPLAALIGQYVVGLPVIHTDDTTVKVLAPGHGKTRTGRFWVYAADPRIWAGTGPPAAFYRYSPDRGRRAAAHAPGGLQRVPACRCLRRLRRALPVIGPACPRG